MRSVQIESLFRQARWTPEEARVVLDAVERSGMTTRGFAAEHDIPVQRLYQWRCRLGEAERTTFREITARPAPQAPAVHRVGAFEVALGNGAVVRVPETFDGDALARLFDVLSRAPSC